jgi:hypothetical protein
MFQTGRLMQAKLSAWRKVEPNDHRSERSHSKHKAISPKENAAKDAVGELGRT